VESERAVCLTGNQETTAFVPGYIREWQRCNDVLTVASAGAALAYVPSLTWGAGAAPGPEGPSGAALRSGGGRRIVNRKRAARRVPPPRRTACPRPRKEHGHGRSQGFPHHSPPGMAAQARGG